MLFAQKPHFFDILEIFSLDKGQINSNVLLLGHAQKSKFEDDVRCGTKANACDGRFTGGTGVNGLIMNVKFLKHAMPVTYTGDSFSITLFALVVKN